MSDLPKLIAANLAETGEHFTTPSVVPPLSYEGYEVSSPFACHWIKHDEVRDTIGSKKYREFKLDRQVHFIQDVHLTGDIQIVGGDEVGVNGCTRKHLVNYAPYDMIDRIEYWSGTTAKKRIEFDGIENHLKRFINTTTHEREGDAVLGLGDMTANERDTAAANDAVQSFEIKIYWPFDRDIRHALNMTCLRDDLEIRLYLKDEDAFINYDGPTALTEVVVSNLKIRTKSFILFQDHYEAITKSWVGRKKGIQYLLDDVQKGTYHINSNSNMLKNGDEVKIDLDPYKGECGYIAAFLRWEDETDNTKALAEGANTDGNLGMDNLLPWKSYSLSDGTSAILEEIDYNFTIWNRNPRTILWSPGLNLLLHPFASSVVDRSNASGSFNLSWWTRGTFNIKLTDAVAAGIAAGRVLRIDFLPHAHNILSLVSVTKSFDRPDAIFTEWLDV